MSAFQDTQHEGVLSMGSTWKLSSEFGMPEITVWLLWRNKSLVATKERNQGSGEPLDWGAPARAPVSLDPFVPQLLHAPGCRMASRASPITQVPVHWTPGEFNFQQQHIRTRFQIGTRVPRWFLWKLMFGNHWVDAEKNVSPRESWVDEGRSSWPAPGKELQPVHPLKNGNVVSSQACFQSREGKCWERGGKRKGDSQVSSLLLLSASALLVWAPYLHGR